MALNVNGTVGYLNVVDWLYGNPPRMMESVHTLLGVGWSDSEHVLPPSPTLVQAPLGKTESAE